MIALGRGRRLAGAWAVPEDDMDEREVIVVVHLIHTSAEPRLQRVQT